MVREIKFRAWHIKSSQMATWEDITELDESGLYPFMDMLSDGLYHVMQYTGLNDRNGKEIYEGDIIRWHDIVSANYFIGFEDGVFCLGSSPNENLWHHREEIPNKWEVIGNVYENSELLEGKK